MAARDRIIEELQSQLAERDSTLTEHARDLAELRDQVSVASTAQAEEVALLKAQLVERDSMVSASRSHSATLREQLVASDQGTHTLLTQLDELNSTVSDLESRLASAGSSLESMSEQYAFIRGQYDTASTAAAREVQLNRELTERINRLKGQLDFGLKQKDLHFEAIKQKLEDETQKLRLQNKLLLDQSRATDDTIRKRAQLFIPVKKENEVLREQVGCLEGRVDKLSTRNEELVSQVERMRAIQMGIMDDGGGAGDDATDTETSSSEEGSPRVKNGRGQASLEQMGYAVRPVGMDSLGSYYSQEDGASRENGAGGVGGGISHLLPSESQLIGVPLSGVEIGKEGKEREVMDAEGWFGCKWGEGEERCAVVLPTKEVRLVSIFHIPYSSPQPYLLLF